jgi:hypothetical protein
VLQIEPCGPPHGENYDYDLFIGHAYAAALQIEQDVVAAEIPGNTYRDTVTGATSTTKTDTSGIIIPFRDTPDGWDDWPPVFTAQYVAYQGAISYTAELPLGRVSNPETNKANSAVDTAVGFQPRVSRCARSRWASTRPRSTDRRSGSSSGTRATPTVTTSSRVRGSRAAT